MGTSTLSISKKDIIYFFDDVINLLKSGVEKDSPYDFEYSMHFSRPGHPDNTLIISIPEQKFGERAPWNKRDEQHKGLTHARNPIELFSDIWNLQVTLNEPFIIKVEGRSIVLTLRIGVFEEYLECYSQTPQVIIKPADKEIPEDIYSSLKKIMNGPGKTFFVPALPVSLPLKRSQEKEPSVLRTLINAVNETIPKSKRILGEFSATKEAHTFRVVAKTEGQLEKLKKLLTSIGTVIKSTSRKRRSHFYAYTYSFNITLAPEFETIGSDSSVFSKACKAILTQHELDPT